MLFSLPKCLSKICFTVFLISISLAVDLQAQSRKNIARTKSQTAADKNKSQKSTLKTDKTDKSSKSKSSDSKKQTADKKRGNAPTAEEKKRRAVEEARQRAAQEARRQAALAEQRRRAEIAREAQARRLGFERGLRTETVENIAKDNIEGEDLEVRLAAVNALGNHAGTVLVMEPQTGKVLTMVNQDWAIRQSFKPCSTIKLVTAIAGLNENRIGEDGKISARRFPMNLDDALAHSNNSYFQAVGAGLGNEKMLAYARMLGLGQPTGINAPNETGGRLPYNNNNGRVYSHGDDFEVTPLQLGVLVSAISNGGKILVPHIPKNRIEKTNYRGAMRYQLALPNDNFKNVLPGMIGAAQYGTAKRGMDSSLGVAGKTGSCTGGGSWLGLFASVAPVSNPKYAVVVITRGQGERGKYAAAIAGKIYSSLRTRLTENGRENLAAIPLELKPQTKINAKTSAKIDVAEGEESEDNDAVVSSQPAPKAVGKKGGAAETFPDVVIKVKKSEQATRPRIVPNKE